MILTCPSCSARYKVDDKAFAGEAGRDVRCAKCQHMWHFDPKTDVSENRSGGMASGKADDSSSASYTMDEAEKSSLNDLINRIQSEEFDEIDFGDGKAGKKVKTPVKNDRLSLIALIKTGVQAIKTKLSRIIAIPVLKLSSFLRKFSAVRRQVIGGLLGIMLFVAVLVTALDNMEAIETAFPPSIKIFQFAKLQWADVPKTKLEDVLVVDHLTIEKEMSGEGNHKEAFDVIKGTLINISQKEVQVPLLTLRMLDQNNLVVSEKNVSTGVEELAGEGQADFAIKLKAGEFPETAVKLELFYGVSAKGKRTDSGKEDDAGSKPEPSPKDHSPEVEG